MASKKRKKKQKLVDEKLIVFLQTSVKIIAFGAVALFVVMNVWSSQYVPQLFFDLANGGEKSIVQVLIKAKDVPQFEDLFPEIRQVVADNVDAIYKESNDRSVQIKKLEALLQSNPESPEILYALHILYKANKDAVRADVYLQRARMIDPQIGQK